jgi:hypothetical protein
MNVRVEGKGDIIQTGGPCSPMTPKLIQLMWGSSCKTTFSNELWISIRPL